MRELIPIVAIVSPFVLVMMILTQKHKAKRRELEHTERMRALELGLTGGVGGSAGWPAIVALGVGAIMPLGLFFIALIASAVSDRPNEEVWITSMVVGFAGVIGGTRLGFRLLNERNAAQAALNDEARLANTNGHRKPSFNPDAYDAIAHRG